MRLLIHSYAPVYPLRNGTGIRILGATPYLTSRHTCDLVQERWNWEEDVSPLGISNHPDGWLEDRYGNVWNIRHREGERCHYRWVWESSALQNLIDELLMSGEYDAVWSGGDTLPLYIRSDHLDRTPLLINPHDSMHLHYRRELRQSNDPMRWMRTLTKWALYAFYQVRVLNKMPYWRMATNRDARSMRRLSPNAHIRVIPNGVSAEWFAPPYTDRDPLTVVFLGTLGYRTTNEISIEWFLRQVWPGVTRSVPGASFMIIGRGASQHLMDMSARHANVKVTGYVEDPRPYLWNAGIFILPMQMGAGIKNKFLEAWAAGCAVVSNRIGAECLQHVHNGENSLVADDPEAMTDALIDLMRDPSSQRDLGVRGQETVRESYTWSAVAARLEQYLMDIANSS